MALQRGMDMARALCEPHTKDIDAGNMVPQDIVVDDKGRAFLADFDIWLLVSSTQGHFYGGKFLHMNGFEAPKKQLEQGAIGAMKIGSRSRARQTYGRLHAS